MPTTNRDERTFATLDPVGTLACARETLGLRQLFTSAGLSVERGDVRLGLCSKAEYVGFVRGFVANLRSSMFVTPAAMARWGAELNRSARYLLQLSGHHSHGCRIGTLRETCTVFPVHGSPHALGREGVGDMVGMYTVQATAGHSRADVLDDMAQHVLLRMQFGGGYGAVRSDGRLGTTLAPQTVAGLRVISTAMFAKIIAVQENPRYWRQWFRAGPPRAVLDSVTPRVVAVVEAGPADGGAVRVARRAALGHGFGEQRQLVYNVLPPALRAAVVSVVGAAAGPGSRGTAAVPVAGAGLRSARGFGAPLAQPVRAMRAVVAVDSRQDIGLTFYETSANRCVWMILGILDGGDPYALQVMAAEAAAAGEGNESLASLLYAARFGPTGARFQAKFQFFALLRRDVEGVQLRNVGFLLAKCLEACAPAYTGVQVPIYESWECGSCGAPGEAEGVTPVLLTTLTNKPGFWAAKGPHETFQRGLNEQCSAQGCAACGSHYMSTTVPIVAGGVPDFLVYGMSREFIKAHNGTLAASLKRVIVRETFNLAVDCGREYVDFGLVAVGAKSVVPASGIKLFLRPVWAAVGLPCPVALCADPLDCDHRAWRDDGDSNLANSFDAATFFASKDLEELVCLCVYASTSRHGAHMAHASGAGHG